MWVLSLYHEIFSWQWERLYLYDVVINLDVIAIV